MSETSLKVALGMTKGICAQAVRAMSEADMPLEAFFELPDDRLAQIVGKRILRSDRDEALFNAAREMKYIEKKKIRIYSLLDEDYPYRLAQCYDAPVVIYASGRFEFPQSNHFLSVVGTRRMTHYGANFCSEAIGELARVVPDLTIVSGLAIGIDGEAHKAALSNGIPTVAVVAHGLNTIYPSEHYKLAADIIHSGGAIISEYPSQTTPFPARFLERNRIVAGLSDATLVVESAVKGGAMSTARLAFEYDRDLLALPGSVKSKSSEGCNALIRGGQATLISSARDIVQTMGWENAAFDCAGEKTTPLFPELEPEVMNIFNAIRDESDVVSIEEIQKRTGCRVAEVMAALSELEAEGLVSRYPGNRYAVN